MDKMKSEQCNNCSQITCKDGREVTEAEFRVGLKVGVNSSHGYWGGYYTGSRGTVASIRGNRVTLKDCQPGSGQYHLYPGPEYYVEYNGTFCFHCETT